MLIAGPGPALTHRGDALSPPLRLSACSHYHRSYMIMDFMETDLHKIIYSKNELTDEHIQVSKNESSAIAGD